MEFIKELKQQATNEINTIKTILMIDVEKTSKKAIMETRRHMILIKYRNKLPDGSVINPRVKDLREKLKCDVNELLKEFDESFNITDEDYNHLNPKIIE